MTFYRRCTHVSNLWTLMILLQSLRSTFEPAKRKAMKHIFKTNVMTKSGTGGPRVRKKFGRAGPADPAPRLAEVR